MRPIRQSVAVTGVSSPIVTDHYIGPFNVGFGVEAAATTTTVTVQHTFDDVFAAGYSPATGVWYDNAGVDASTVGNVDGNYAFPVTAIRINVTANTSGNPVNFTVVQAGRTGD
jgi:hypothetical protein